MPPAPPHLILLMGVTGSGKTTLGRRLATELGWPYFEADDFHSDANRDKMSRGVALTDEEIEQIWSVVPIGTPVEIKP